LSRGVAEWHCNLSGNHGTETLKIIDR